MLGRLKQERGLQKQKFEATAVQTAFTVTEFSLNDDYCVYENGILTESGQSRSGQVVTFTVGRPEGTEIVIMN